jgi:hypothetical protein
MIAGIIAKSFVEKACRSKASFLKQDKPTEAVFLVVSDPSMNEQ